jgi:hypothetical protein
MESRNNDETEENFTEPPIEQAQALDEIQDADLFKYDLSNQLNFQSEQLPVKKKVITKATKSKPK